MTAWTDADRRQYARELGVTIRSIRIQRGWTLKAAAKHTGIKEAALGSWERADRAVSVLQLARLARAYRCDVLDLIPNGRL